MPGHVDRIAILRCAERSVYIDRLVTVQILVLSLRILSPKCRSQCGVRSKGYGPPVRAGHKLYSGVSSRSSRSFCCLSMTVESSSIPVTARSVPSQVLRTIRDAQLTDSMMLQTDCGSSEALDTFFMMGS